MPVDFASAALRHIRDAEDLLDSSVDQAWHLAGFAHECARKACLREGWIPKLLGHDFSEAGEQVVEVGISLDPRASRFPLRDWASRYSVIASWRPDHRYERTGTVRASERNVEALVEQGRTATNACIVALFLDGAIGVESLQ